MNKKILLPVFLGMMTVTAAEVTPENNANQGHWTTAKEIVFSETLEYRKTSSFKIPA